MINKYKYKYCCVGSNHQGTALSSCSARWGMGVTPPVPLPVPGVRMNLSNLLFLTKFDSSSSWTRSSLSDPSLQIKRLVPLGRAKAQKIANPAKYAIVLLL
jgi:hypothetical protein